MKTPHHPLVDVKAVASAGRVRLLKTRALEPLMDAIPSTDTVSKATAFAAQTIADLTDAAFAETVEQNFVVCDAYGVILDGRGFYEALPRRGLGW